MKLSKLYSTLHNLIYTTINKRKQIVYRIPDSLRNGICQSSLEYRLCAVEYHNLKDVLLFRNSETVEKFISYLKEGQHGYYLYKLTGECIAHGWIITNNTQRVCLANGYFPLPSKSVLIHFCSIDPKYRGQNIYKELLRQIYIQIPRSLEIWIDANDKNVPAYRGIESSGAVKQFSMTVIRFKNKLLFRHIFEYKITE